MKSRVVPRRPSHLIQVGVALLLALSLTTGCLRHVNSTRTYSEVVNRQVVEETVSYEARAVSLQGSDLVVALGRSCGQVEQQQYERIRAEDVEYNGLLAYMAVLSVGSAGGMGAMIAGFNDASDVAMGIGISSAIFTAAGMGAVAWYDVGSHTEEEVLERGTELKEQSIACGDRPWPGGDVTFMVPAAGQSFTGSLTSSGHARVNLTGARPEAWVEESPAQLSLPEDAGWVELTIPDAVRARLAFDGTAEDPQTERRATRAYVYTSRELERQSLDGERAGALLGASVARVQSVLTDSGRFRFAADAETRKRLDAIVEQAGGSLVERREKAVVAARQQNVDRVIELTVALLSEESAQLVMSVFDTAGGDQVYSKDAVIAVGNPESALASVDELAEGYLVFERR